MKKLIALVLSLTMLLGCVSALGETAAKESITMLGAFSIQYDKLPEGFILAETQNDEMVYAAMISSTEAGKPIYLLSIEFSDAWDGVNTLADATADDIAAVKEDFYNVLEMDDGEITFEDGQTGLGTPLLIAKAADGSFGAVYTIYMSHEIEVDFFRDGDEKVTEEDFNTIIQFLTDVDFVPVEK